MSFILRIKSKKNDTNIASHPPAASHPAAPRISRLKKIIRWILTILSCGFYNPNRLLKISTPPPIQVKDWKPLIEKLEDNLNTQTNTSKITMATYAQIINGQDSWHGIHINGNHFIACEEALCFLGEPFLDKQIIDIVKNSYHFNPKKPIHAWVTTLQHRLNEGKPILIPSGFSARDAGHCIYLLLSKNINGSYQIKIINTGGGIGYHPQSKTNTGRDKVQPVMIFDKLTKKECFNIHLWENLSKGMCFTDFATQNQPNSDWFYKVFNTFIKKQPIFPSEEPIIQPQKAGNCAWRSLLTAVRSLMANQNISHQTQKTTIFLIKWRALLHLQQNLNSNDPDYMAALHLLESGARGLIKRLATMKCAGFSMENEERVREKLIQIEKFAEEKLKALLSSQQNTTFSVNSRLPNPFIVPQKSLIAHELKNENEQLITEKYENHNLSITSKEDQEIIEARLNDLEKNRLFCNKNKQNYSWFSRCAFIEESFFRDINFKFDPEEKITLEIAKNGIVLLKKIIMNIFSGASDKCSLKKLVYGSKILELMHKLFRSYLIESKLNDLLFQFDSKTFAYPDLNQPQWRNELLNDDDFALKELFDSLISTHRTPEANKALPILSFFIGERHIDPDPKITNPDKSNFALNYIYQMTDLLNKKNPSEKISPAEFLYDQNKSWEDPFLYLIYTQDLLISLTNTTLTENKNRVESRNLCCMERLYQTFPSFGFFNRNEKKPVKIQYTFIGNEKRIKGKYHLTATYNTQQQHLEVISFHNNIQKRYWDIKNEDKTIVAPSVLTSNYLQNLESLHINDISSWYMISLYLFLPHIFPISPIAEIESLEESACNSFFQTHLVPESLKKNSNFEDLSSRALNEIFYKLQLANLIYEKLTNPITKKALERIFTEFFSPRIIEWLDQTIIPFNDLSSYQTLALIYFESCWILSSKNSSDPNLWAQWKRIALISISDPLLICQNNPQLRNRVTSILFSMTKALNTDPEKHLRYIENVNKFKKITDFCYEFTDSNENNLNIDFSFWGISYNNTQKSKVSDNLNPRLKQQCVFLFGEFKAQEILKNKSPAPFIHKGVTFSVSSGDLMYHANNEQYKCILCKTPEGKTPNLFIWQNSSTPSIEYLYSLLPETVLNNPSANPVPLNASTSSKIDKKNPSIKPLSDQRMQKIGRVENRSIIIEPNKKLLESMEILDLPKELTNNWCYLENLNDNYYEIWSSFSTEQNQTLKLRLHGNTITLLEDENWKLLPYSHLPLYKFFHPYLFFHNSLTGNYKIVFQIEPIDNSSLLPVEKELANFPKNTTYTISFNPNKTTIAESFLAGSQKEQLALTYFLLHSPFFSDREILEFFLSIPRSTSNDHVEPILKKIAESKKQRIKLNLSTTDTHYLQLIQSAGNTDLESCFPCPIQLQFNSTFNENNSRRSEQPERFEEKKTDHPYTSFLSKREFTRVIGNIDFGNYSTIEKTTKDNIRRFISNTSSFSNIIATLIKNPESPDINTALYNWIKNSVLSLNKDEMIFLSDSMIFRSIALSLVSFCIKNKTGWIKFCKKFNKIKYPSYNCKQLTQEAVDLIYKYYKKYEEPIAEQNPINITIPQMTLKNPTWNLSLEQVPVKSIKLEKPTTITETETSILENLPLEQLLSRDLGIRSTPDDRSLALFLLDPRENHFGVSDKTKLDSLAFLVKERFIKEVVNLRSAPLPYSTEEHMELLIFEYLTKITLREDQIKTFISLKENNRCFCQKTPGFGKTKVLFPLLMLLFAPKMQSIILPEALLASCSRDLEQIGRKLGIKIMHLNGSLEFLTSSKGLDNVETILDHLKESHATLITTREKIDLLWAVLPLMIIKKSDPMCITRWHKIYETMKEIHLTCDEADTQLSSLLSTIFAIDPPVSFSKETFQFCLETFKTLLDVPCFNEALAKNTLTSLTKEQKQEIRNHLLSTFSPLKGALSLSDQEWKLYFTEDSNEKNAISEKLSSLYKNKANEPYLTTLAILAFIIRENFGLDTLCRQIFFKEHAGLSKKETNNVIAIPYEKGSPIEGSIYQNPLITVFLTFAIWSIDGIWDATKKELCQEFYDWCLEYKKEIPSEFYNRHPILEKLDSLENFTEALTNNLGKELTLQFLTEKKLPHQVLIYPSFMKVSASDLLNTHKNIITLSGTREGIESLGGDIKDLGKDPVEDRLLAVLQENTAHKTLVMAKEDIPQIDEHFSAFIDYGVFFRNETTSQMLAYFDKRISKNRPFIFYYDHIEGGSSALHVYNRSSKQITILHGSNYEEFARQLVSQESSPDDLSKLSFVFYDYAHIIGSDIYHHKDAHACISFGEKSDATLFCQASLRMRKLLAGEHYLTFIVEPSVANSINLESKTTDGEKIQCLFEAALKKTQEKEKSISLARLFDLLYAKARQLYLNSSSLSNSNAAQTLFISTQPTTAFEIAGIPPQKKPTHEIIKEKIKSLAKACPSPREAEIQLKEIWDAFPQKLLDREMVVGSETINQTIFVSSQAQAQTQAQVQVKTQVQVQVQAQSYGNIVFQGKIKVKPWLGEFLFNKFDEKSTATIENHYPYSSTLFDLCLKELEESIISKSKALSLSEVLKEAPNFACLNTVFSDLFFISDYAISPYDYTNEKYRKSRFLEENKTNFFFFDNRDPQKPFILFLNDSEADFVRQWMGVIRAGFEHHKEKTPDIQLVSKKGTSIASCQKNPKTALPLLALIQIAWIKGDVPSIYQHLQNPDSKKALKEWITPLCSTTRKQLFILFEKMANENLIEDPFYQVVKYFIKEGSSKDRPSLDKFFSCGTRN